MPTQRFVKGFQKLFCFFLLCVMLYIFVNIYTLFRAEPLKKGRICLSKNKHWFYPNEIHTPLVASPLYKGRCCSLARCEHSIPYSHARNAITDFQPCVFFYCGLFRTHSPLSYFGYNIFNSPNAVPFFSGVVVTTNRLT